MRFFSDWFDVLNSGRSEIVFEFRNKDYGAYELRKKYSSYSIIALLISITLICTGALSPRLISFFSAHNDSTHLKNTDAITLEEPPPIDKISPPPPLVIPPPPVIQTIKFTPPVVVRDEEAEDPPPTQEEVKNERVGTETQEGLTDMIDLPPELNTAPEGEQIFTVVEEMPTFPGGDKARAKYLSRIRYPNVAKEQNITGFVYLNFIVDKDGKVKEANVIKGIGGGCDEEALRVVNAMPEWKPGKQNGRSVAVRMNIRINFSLR